VIEGSGSPTRRAIASLSSAGLNPYLELLYRSLVAVGVSTVPNADLRVRWLASHRRSVRYLHVHWPEGLYRFERGPSRLRVPLSWAKLALLRTRLGVARALGYRLIWTVHQVYPHDTASARLDRAGARMLARQASLMLAHDPETAEHARQELAPATGSVEVIGHGSYVGVYPPGRPRDEVRSELGIADKRVAFLCFGELRADSDIAILVEAFVQRSDADVALVIAGNAKDQRAGDVVAAAAAADSRVVWIEGFVPAERVRELYEATDVAVISRANGGTSGSLILALSLGSPVVVADMPAYRRLTGDGAAGWLFRRGDVDELRLALEISAADESGRTERADAARRIAASLDWNAAAAQIASLLPR
jgi:glycosyltransferase involved in cell wall biosynthesis